MHKISYFIRTYFAEMIWIMTVGVFGRLVRFMPNVTPFTALSLFAGSNLPRSVATFIMLVTLLISDIFLAFILGCPIISYFTIFSYTGFALVVFLGSKIKYGTKWLPAYVLGSSTLFWVWTNFGVWLTSALYPKTFAGLVSCYYMALPFLRNIVIGDLVCSCLIFGIFYFLAEKLNMLVASK